ncbi:MAG TPA: hypothetical protein DCX54_08665 [Flavobacteriales bacterium]|nr:hypothetical protein [Flavobacteriales bacterium]
MCLYEAPIRANDNCRGAQLLFVDSTVKVVPCDTLTNRYATHQGTSVAPNPTCGFYGGGDVWYKTVMPSSGYLNIVISEYTSQFAVYKGTCGSMTQINCVTLNGNRNIRDASLAGDTIYIRVFTYGNEEGQEFFLTLYEPRFPVNDDCANAIDLSPGNAVYSNAFATADTAGTAPNPTCGFYNGADVWFTYTVPASGEIKILKKNLGAGILPMMQLYSGVCGNMTRLQCAQFNSTIQFTDSNLIGQKLYLRVFSYSSSSGGSFGLCAYDSVCKGFTRYNRERFMCRCDDIHLGSNQVLTSNNKYTEHYKAADGSDSILLYSLVEAPTYAVDAYDTVCLGSSYTFPDSTHIPIVNIPFRQISYFETQFGCDSVVTYHIDTFSIYQNNIFDTVCSGANYITPEGDTLFAVSSSVVDTSFITSSRGCDSLSIVDLFVKPQYYFIYYDSICVGSDYISRSGDTIFNVMASFTDSINTGHTPYRCDSITTSYVRVFPVFNALVTDSVCHGDSYTFPDNRTINNLVSNVIDTSFFFTARGCDSLIVTDLRVNPVYNIVAYDSICRGDSYTFPDNTSLNNIDSSLSYISTLQGKSSCDSLIETRLNVYIIDTSITISGGRLTGNSMSNTSYQWLDCDDNMSIMSGQTGTSLITPATNGTYALAFENNNCHDTSSCHFMAGVGIEENQTVRNIKFYPNPSNRNFTFELDGEIDGLLLFYDQTGRLAFSLSVKARNQIQVTLPEYIGYGLYYVRFVGGELDYSQLLLIKDNR